MEVIRYTRDLSETWDNFISSSECGHFMFKRAYMDYHMDRFQDHSLLFMEGKKLLSVFPANECDGRMFSHQGLSFAGMILGSKVYTVEVLQIFSALKKYMKHVGILNLIYKVMPQIYNQGTREECLYALYIQKADLVRRDISSVIDMQSNFKYRSTKKQNIKKGVNSGLMWSPLTDLSGLWILLKEVLATRHDSSPTHSHEEIELLMARFPENILGYGVTLEGRLLGGAVLFINHNVVHTQYLAVNEEGRLIGALDFLIDKLIEKYRVTKRYFSFGISTENEGRELNTGLVFQKEGFGARGVTHDFYRLDS